MNNTLATLLNNPITIATRDAIARTGRQGLGTQVRKGLWQVVDVTQTGKRGKTTVTPLSNWVPVDEVVGILQSLT